MVLADGRSMYRGGGGTLPCDKMIRTCGMKPNRLQDEWCEARGMSGVKHVGLQKVWCEARRISGVKLVGLQEKWCEAKSASRMCGVKLAG